MRATHKVFNVYTTPRVRWHMWVRSFMADLRVERSISRIAQRLYTLVGRRRW